LQHVPPGLDVVQYVLMTLFGQVQDFL
jgi:hypothetical protein